MYRWQIFCTDDGLTDNRQTFTKSKTFMWWVGLPHLWLARTQTHTDMSGHFTIFKSFEVTRSGYTLTGYLWSRNYLSYYIQRQETDWDTILDRSQEK